MADFCKQCSIELFEVDYGNLKNLGGDKKEIRPDFGWDAICEDCGFILVNDAGECIQSKEAGCLKGHGD